MRLHEVTVQNYRSITQLTRFDVGDLTTLVGPNNEGKSNLLRALALGMEVIKRWPIAAQQGGTRSELTGPGARYVMRGSMIQTAGFGGDDRLGRYDWQRDYPLDKQEISGSQPTVIRLLFKMEDTEISEFQAETSIRNNGDLPVEIRLTRTTAALGIVKPGKGAATHRAKANVISRFISNHLKFVSIPAVRTSEQAQALVNDLARLKLRTLTKSDEYVELATKMNELRRTALSQIEEGLTVSVKEYLPSIRRVTFQPADVEEADAVNDVTIDDGAVTSITSKGDGIKSLLTMALIHELAKENARNESFILAVDEPEAHLHPNSVHELQQLFIDLSSTQQVILATHNPIFVNRERPHSNILVLGNKAQPARSVTQIREAIGVRLYDNLDSAETVVLVEGLTDETTLPAVLGAMNPDWRSRFATGTVVFKATKGTGKLRTAIQREKSTLCRIIVVLDGDEAGRAEARNLETGNLIPSQNVFLLGRHSKRVSELEDLLQPSVYLSELTQTFGRPFTEAHFNRMDRKWSDNLEQAATVLGIPDAGKTLTDKAKVAVAEAVRMGNTSDMVYEDSRETLNALGTLIFPPR